LVKRGREEKAENQQNNRCSPNAARQKPAEANLLKQKLSLSITMSKRRPAISFPCPPDGERISIEGTR
jgi:hypothetical protein